MPSSKTEPPFLSSFLVLLAIQFPVWLAAGALWAVVMTVVFGYDPVGAFLGGLWFGVLIGLICGSLFAAALAWRRAASFPAPDRPGFLAALKKAADKVRLTVLAELADEVVLGPKRVLVRFRLQETRVTFSDGVAVVSGPAATLWALKRRLVRELPTPAVEKE